ncbi:uncharacterized protein HMPREF1541_01112 [Cyphellophora europaea CBS 101466]|uniref:BTB domain-containing protein n=1 Tax=Cyphellophora europaea (strain CBS 101466) TaxID=1220924 RepID=W2SG03_CYPE1|nr:uncharacterized protein HMPREF1541_01112 [Cyphellophora europaea CBS 101466]ETN46923.1 hypothetical protein HMPREF1541_01112 [Cyphellophora europaea CBS 101466]
MSGLSLATLTGLATNHPDSDFIIECEGVRFNVHRLIVKAGSDFFRALCTNDCQENKASHCNLPEDDPETIGRVIQFLYTGSYPVDTKPITMPQDNDGQGSVASSPLSEYKTGSEQTLDEPSDPDGYTWMWLGYKISQSKKHVLVHQAADKLGIPTLKQFSLALLQVDCVDLMVDHGDFANLLELVYNTTPTNDDGLRFFFTERTLNSAWFPSHERLARLVEQHEGMAYRVWRKTRADDARRRQDRRLRCRIQKQNRGRA